MYAENTLSLSCMEELFKCKNLLHVHVCSFQAFCLHTCKSALALTMYKLVVPSKSALDPFWE